MPINTHKINLCYKIAFIATLTLILAWGVKFYFFLPKKMEYISKPLVTSENSPPQPSKLPFKRGGVVYLPKDKRCFITTLCPTGPRFCNIECVERYGNLKGGDCFEGSGICCCHKVM